MTPWTAGFRSAVRVRAQASTADPGPRDRRAKRVGSGSGCLGLGVREAAPGPDRSAWAQPRAPERPVPRSCAQAGLHGIELDVAHALLEVLAAPNSAIEVLGLPEPPGPLQQAIGLGRGMPLPSMNDSSERPADLAAHDDVDVSRHDDPGHESITLWVEVQEGAFDAFRDPGIAEPAPAPTGIEFPFHLTKSFDLGPIRILLRLGFPAIEQVARQTVGKAKGDELRGAWPVGMYEIPPIVPGRFELR